MHVTASSSPHDPLATERMGQEGPEKPLASMHMELLVTARSLGTQSA